MKPRNHEEHMQHSFDSFCKKVLKRKAVDIQREAKKRGEREISFSELSEREKASLAVEDKYFTDEYVFSVIGESVGVSDADLAEALTALPVDRREIVLMSYFFDLSDREIAKRLNMAKSTVTYQRTNSLRLLKKLMESEV